MITLTLPIWSVALIILLGAALLAVQVLRVLLLLETKSQQRELQAFAQHWRSWQRSRTAYDAALKEATSSASSGFQPRQSYWQSESGDTRPI